MRKQILFILSILLVSYVAYAQERSVTIQPPTATIAPGGSIQLTASGADYYRWAPAESLSSPTGTRVVASPTVTTTYTATGYSPTGYDRVENGDFEQGVYGFNSDYQRNDVSLWSDGTYTVGEDAHAFHENFTGHGHGGSGKFMIVNGSVFPNTIVWTETRGVQPNTDYAFQTWVCTVCTGNEAQLQFSINGEQLGEVFRAPIQLNDWQCFYQIWNSGNSSSATITILNQNTQAGGNDFGLDDISFYQLSSVGQGTSTVTVRTDNMSAGNDYANTCYQTPVTIDFLSNDHLLESCNNMGCTIISQPSHGTASYTNGVMRYTPANGYDGNDQFRYRITCGADYAEANVNITVYDELLSIVYISGCNEAHFHGHTYTHTGTEYLTLPGAGAHGCDSVYELRVTVWNDVTKDIYEEACEHYEWHGTDYAQSGVYEYHTQTTHGCDSTVYLHLTIHNAYSNTQTVSTCDSYSWEGEIYNESGFYTKNYHTAHGCDSILNLDLTISDSFEQEESQTACERYWWRGAWREETNDYTDFASGVGGCDSTFILHLTIDHAVQTEINGSGCNQYTLPWGETVTEDGPYSHHYQTAVGGCDSLVTCYVTITSNSFYSETVTTCLNPYPWEGHGMVSGPGPHYDTIQTGDCFEVYELFLEEGEQPVYTADTLVCDGFEWHGMIANQVGLDTLEYTDRDPLTGCIATYQMRVEVVESPEFQLSGLSHIVAATSYWPGTYLYYVNSEMSLDSTSYVWTLSRDDWQLLPNGASCRVVATSIGSAELSVSYGTPTCDTVTESMTINASGYGVGDNESQVLVYPNPTHNSVTVEAATLQRVRLCDLQGRILFELDSIENEKAVLDLHDYAPSIYLLDIQTKEGISHHTIVLAK